jgi:hypothetical protein
MRAHVVGASNAWISLDVRPVVANAVLRSVALVAAGWLACVDASSSGDLGLGSWAGGMLASGAFMAGRIRPQLEHIGAEHA